MTLPVVVLRGDLTGTAFGATPTWTDYTAYLETGPAGQSVDITYGRQDNRADVPPGGFTFLLNNTDGRFTNGSSVIAVGHLFNVQVGASSSSIADTFPTYFPASFGTDTTMTDRATGYVASVEPTWPGGVQSWSVVRVSCVDVTAQLGSSKPLLPLVVQEMLANDPASPPPLPYFLYRLNEQAGAITAGATYGNFGTLTRVDANGQGALSFGEQIDLAESVTGVKFAETSQAAGTPTSALKVPSRAILDVGAWSLEAWVQPVADAAPANPSDILSIADDSGSTGVTLRLSATSGRVVFFAQTAASTDALIFSTAGVNLADGKLHHLVVTVGSDSRSVTLYVDGVAVGTTTATRDIPLRLAYNNLIGASQVARKPRYPFAGVIANVAAYANALSASRVARLNQVGRGTYVERSDLRFARLAGYAKVTTTGLPTGQAMIGHQNTEGRNVIDVLAEVARTEGFFAYPNATGAVTFQVRNARYNDTSVLTLTGDDIAEDVAIRQDRQDFFNQLSVSRPGGATQQASNATSQAGKDGIWDGGSLDVASSTDYDALQVASWQVATHSVLAPRIPSLTIDLLSRDATFITSVLNLRIGDLVTLTSIPSQAPSPSLSLFLEGGHEVIGVQEWYVEFFTSPNLPATLRADGSPSAFTKLDAGLKIPL